MIVELKPETERLLRQAIKSGHFRSVDDVIVRAIQVMRETNFLPPPTKKNFAQFLLDSPLRGSGLELKRQKSSPRPIDL